MPEFIPPIPKDFHGSMGEKIVYDAFRSLPDSYLVFHSFAWTEEENNSFHKQGEADFLVYDPERGLLVIEVKSGQILIENEEWFQIGKDGHRRLMHKNPYFQAEESKFYILKQILERRLPHGEKCPINTCLFFPQHSFQRANLPSYLKRDFILDNSNLPHINKGIDRVFQYYNSHLQINLSKSSRENIKKWLNPYFKLVPVQKWDIEVREEQFLRLTKEQSLLLDFLEEQDRAVIGGGAGTGKTILAVEHARRLSQDGDKVLFLVYNSLLKKNISIEHFKTDPNIDVHSYFSLAEEYEKNIPDKRERAGIFTKDLLAGKNVIPHTHIIVDEGQDFEEEWLRALESVVPGKFFVYYDKGQMVHKKASDLPTWLKEAECRLVLKSNCRNTRQIATTANSFIGVETLKFKNEIDGPIPIWIECEDDSDFLRRTITIIKEKVSKENIQPEQITLATTISMDSSYLGQLSVIHNIPVSKERIIKQIQKTTIRKFKGLEADILLLVDVDFSQIQSESWRKLLYTASSRAKHELYILSNKLSSLTLGEKKYSPKEARSYIANTFHLHRLEN
ncbi:MAG TPA: NERD domain-containing protein [Leptospiraceae bacterium]|nr:NERD domain-containing protein [Leptospiraceae bacterium]HMW05704.1 NERD domain-containing protein [Leptospiraceae bacterium]HMX34883.1 NERD domain-containing protein [Leptospiraceae bacterium]HMY30263.1 NERD domain-containing protein [Leptospiraceae bacterium]HNA07158.1 NERD domain-containing protein [Leptospiraceae bacterium]